LNDGGENQAVATGATGNAIFVLQNLDGIDLLHKDINSQETHLRTIESARLQCVSLSEGGKIKTVLRL